MPVPDLGKPERPARGARHGCIYLFGISTLFVCALVGLAGLALWPRQSPFTMPTVVITEPHPGSQVIVNEPVFVLARVDDPDGVAKAELWVSGQLVATQVNSAGGGGHLLVSQVWRPTKSGAYTVQVRGMDTTGYVGESAALIVETVEKGTQHDQVRLQVIAQPGDTVAAIAQQFGTTPEQMRSDNLDLGSGEIAPGDSILVPHPPESGPPDDTPIPGTRPADVPSGDGPAQVPPVEPPPEELLVPDQSQPADPQDSSFWDRLPGWREALCNRQLGFMGGWLGCADQPRPRWGTERPAQSFCAVRRQLSSKSKLGGCLGR